MVRYLENLGELPFKKQKRNETQKWFVKFSNQIHNHFIQLTDYNLNPEQIHKIQGLKASSSDLDKFPLTEARHLLTGLSGF